MTGGMLTWYPGRRGRIEVIPEYGGVSVCIRIDGILDEIHALQYIPSRLNAERMSLMMQDAGH